jgi:hypothetical protein
LVGKGDKLMEPNAFDEQLSICAKAGDDYETQIRATALCSIAISLKRIADKLELSQKQPYVAPLNGA